MKTDLTSIEFVNSEGHESLYALWTARLFFDRKVRRKLEQGQGIMRRGADYERDFQQLLGLSYFDTAEDAAIEKMTFEVKSLLESLSKINLSANGNLGSNLEKLKLFLGLSSTDTLVLQFFILLNLNSTFEDLVDSLLGDLTQKELVYFLNVFLQIPEKKLKASLSKEGYLNQTGILRVDRSNTNMISCKVDLLRNLEEVISEESDSPLSLLKEYFYEATPAELPLNKFTHLDFYSENISSYLKRLQSNRQGVNFLVYGPPGTGKTQWVKALCESLGQTVYEVSSSDDDGDAINKSRRVEHYKLAQKALQNSANSLVVFDEVEDVFPTSFMSFFGMSKNNASTGKAWLTKLLEENPVPAFWISNNIKQIDPAYIRRFDFVIEIDVPPRSIRLEIIKNCLNGCNIEPELLDKLADEKQLSPAIISRSAKVLEKSCGSKVSVKDSQHKLIKLINDTLEAQGQKPLNVKTNNRGIEYSLDLINTDIDLGSLVKGVQRSNSSRICLYGPPGTGKTAFGHHLAKSVDKPLIIKRASDLLSPYVGEAEQNIASAFKEAVKEGAVLQIDEADSFLQNREGATRSWEVTQVNEFLTQMESYEGILIVSTNLMDNIDQAAMRRFDLKLEFKALTSDQAWRMVKSLFVEYEIEDYDELEIRESLKELSLLTPGDFSAVIRRFNITGHTPTANNLFEELAQECSYKPNYQKSSGIGFMSHLTH